MQKLRKSFFLESQESNKHFGNQAEELFYLNFLKKEGFFNIL